MAASQRNMIESGNEIIIGIDAGTSLIKAVAFNLSGCMAAHAVIPNHYTLRPDGAAFQPMLRSWADCAATLRMLGEKIPDLASRTVAIAVTAQGDGTWLIGAEDQPIGEGWLWLDSRSAPTVRDLRTTEADQLRFEITGTGLNACQMGSQMAHMGAQQPERLAQAEAALHCKDWLYLKLTGIRATDPSEAVFTFGNYRSRAYDTRVIEALGLEAYRHLLPEIIDGTQQTHPLTAAAAAETSLRAGTPVVLGYVDVVCTALAAGIYDGEESSGCTILGTTGMHMRACPAERVQLGAEKTGYVMMLPVPGIVAQAQSNMAATLNIDWFLDMIAGAMKDLGFACDRAQLIGQIEHWLATGTPGELLYHPYISDAGERGPFIDATARASFTGLRTTHGVADMVRALIEGLALAARDCYLAMGEIPATISLTGGAARSPGVRHILAAVLGCHIRRALRDEGGAAGAAMIAATAIGIYSDMTSCIRHWALPTLGKPEPPDTALMAIYEPIFTAYQSTRHGLAPSWARLAEIREQIHG